MKDFCDFFIVPVMPVINKRIEYSIMIMELVNTSILRVRGCTCNVRSLFHNNFT